MLRFQLGMMVPFLIVFAGCRTAPKDVATQKEGLTLEYLISQKVTGRELHKEIPPTTEENLNAADKEAEVLEAEGAADAEVVSKRFRLNDVKKHLAKKNFEELKTVPFRGLLKAVQSLNDNKLKSLVSDLATAEVCAPPNLTFAVASLLERQFPDEWAVQQSRALHAKTMNCNPTADIQSRTNYRLAMFNLLHNQCDRAMENLQPLAQTKDRSYRSRAQYWSQWCQKTENKMVQEAEQFFAQFPTSYHSIVFSQKNEVDLYSKISKLNRTPILLRSEKVEAVNDLIKDIESHQENQPNRFYLARQFQAILDHHLEKIEPELMIYLGYLSFVQQQHLSSIQFLAKAFSIKPELMTMASMNLYYPQTYYDIIEKVARENQVDPVLVISLVRQESAFNHRAASRAGARGLMQLLPSTARLMDRSVKRNQLFDPEKNIQVGVRYLASLLKRYDNNVVYTLAAYNAGPGHIDQWIKRYSTDNALLFMDSVPFQETREYVASILRNAYWYNSILKPDIKQEQKLSMTSARDKQ